MADYVRAIDNMTNHTSGDLRGAVNDFIRSEGVLDLDGGHFLVTEKGTPDMSVDVAEGIAYVLNDSFTEFASTQHYWDVLKDASENLSISSNSSGSTRIDIVCIKIDTGASPDANASNVMTTIVVEGTPGAGTPSTPSNHLKLAEITVANGETSITTSEISDTRVQVAFGQLLDEDAFTSNSATIAPSQQSVKVYVDTPIKSIVLTAGGLSPTTTAGCASATIVEAGTNDVDYTVLDFDASTEENCFTTFAMPDGWDAGTITAKFYWTAASGSGDVIWGIKGRAFANDDAIDQAYGTAQTVTDTLITAGDVHVSSATNAMTFAGTPAGGQLVQLKIYRDADAGGDTFSADARLIAVKIEYTLATHSD